MINFNGNDDSTKITVSQWKAEVQAESKKAGINEDIISAGSIFIQANNLPDADNDKTTLNSTEYRNAQILLKEWIQQILTDIKYGQREQDGTPKQSFGEKVANTWNSFKGTIGLK